LPSVIIHFTGQRFHGMYTVSYQIKVKHCYSVGGGVLSFLI